MKICRVCHGEDLQFLWYDPDRCAWWRCRTCGSDSNVTLDYNPRDYACEYAARLLADEGGTMAAAIANHQHNADLFDNHAPEGEGFPSFLDVGCGHGASGYVMAARGWDQARFDVSREGRPAGAVIAPEFRADLFAGPFDAVLAREVLEHVPNPHDFLRQLFQATAPGGLCQITTPRPMLAGDAYRCYQRWHLALWAPRHLKGTLMCLGFDVVETQIWDLGQRHMCRRPA